MTAVKAVIIQLLTKIPRGQENLQVVILCSSCIIAYLLQKVPSFSCQIAPSSTIQAKICYIPKWADWRFLGGGYPSSRLTVRSAVYHLRNSFTSSTSCLCHVLTNTRCMKQVSEHFSYWTWSCWGSIRSSKPRHKFLILPASGHNFPLASPTAFILPPSRRRWSGSPEPHPLFKHISPLTPSIIVTRDTRESICMSSVAGSWWGLKLRKWITDGLV